MIGLSVSACVRDLATGKVAMADVEKIVGGTRIRSWKNMKILIKQYLRSYWLKKPVECEIMMRQLISNTKRAKRGRDPRGPIIEQPRLKKGGRAPCLATEHGIIHWVNTESEIKWC